MATTTPIRNALRDTAHSQTVRCNMTKMKYNLLIITIGLLIYSCTSSTTKESTQANGEARIEGKYSSNINSKVTIIDTTLNPFANGLLFSGRDCENEKERINCVISKFPPRPLPMHFGPIPEVSLNSNFELSDSLFITEALQDTNYFAEEERQYSYYLGVNIPSRNNFQTVVIPEWFSVGKRYILLTISNSGDYIDKLVIGSESSDYESVFGKIESFNNIEVTTKKIGFDESKDLLYFSSSDKEQYLINEKGKIIKK